MTFHVEAAAAPVRLARELRSAGARAGMALQARHRRSSPYADLLPELDMVLVMTVEPGFGGQSFMADHAAEDPRGRARLVDAHGGEIWLQVDGGVSADTIEQCAEAGADVFVAGSAVYGADDAAAAVDELRALAARHGHARLNRSARRATRSASFVDAVPRRVARDRGIGVGDGAVAYWRHVLRGRCNSEPAVTVRDPAAASGRLTWWNSRTDGESPDGRQHAEGTGPSPVAGGPFVWPHVVVVRTRVRASASSPTTHSPGARPTEPSTRAGHDPPAAGRRDAALVRRALELAVRGPAGTPTRASARSCSTAPGRSSARASTAAPGSPHAEVEALAQAGERGPRRHGLRHARAVQPHRPHRSVRPGPASMPV